MISCFLKNLSDGLFLFIKSKFHKAKIKYQKYRYTFF